MLNEKNVKDYLKKIASSRKDFIDNIKNDVCEYKSRLSDISVDFAFPVYDGDDISKLDELYTVLIEEEVFEYLHTSEYKTGTIYDDERWERKWLVIDGITLESHIFKPSEAVQDA